MALLLVEKVQRDAECGRSCIKRTGEAWEVYPGGIPAGKRRPQVGTRHNIFCVEINTFYGKNIKQ
jgi:hypothetical protein